ncbi:hypothetical protein [Stigmatella erecta]|uniref:Cupin domain-containing protein n=1 Tax=Stigmatella erecta TaxID=83460 RepID=A0A1I0L784_9BACT|nr:hypothetical protein [Stigmatella erecta]SEU35740.1 hypothetical protein SAMN05443639_12120 [Stigmatella erecta]
MHGYRPTAASYNEHFNLYTGKDGLIGSDPHGAYPTTVSAWSSPGYQLKLEGEGTHFIFVQEGRAEIIVQHPGIGPTAYTLQSMMYMSAAGPVTVTGGKGFAVTRLQYTGLFSMGGPLERQGRLRYIDGCSDTLLLSPVKKGDACLNHLHFPAGISQTQHTHPSIRCGIVARGHGRCVIPSADGQSTVSIPLQPGAVFVIPPEGHHSFFTGTETMDVIAYHPDSDTGPEDDDHPMVNRTIVDGVPAARLSAIRTQDIRE